jgi:hypothetical protein
MPAFRKTQEQARCAPKNAADKIPATLLLTFSPPLSFPEAKLFFAALLLTTFN